MAPRTSAPVRARRAPSLARRWYFLLGCHETGPTMADLPPTFPRAILRKLPEAPRPNEVVEFPRRTSQTGESVGRLRVQVLTAIEHDDARERVHRAYRERQFSVEELAGYIMKEAAGDKAIAREVLAMACQAPRASSSSLKMTSPARLSRRARLEAALTSRRDSGSLQRVLAAQPKYGPFDRNVTTKDDQDAWIRRLEEGGSEFPLLRLPLPALVVDSSLAHRIIAVRHPES